jgi:hypothetical protein
MQPRAYRFMNLAALIALAPALLVAGPLHALPGTNMQQSKPARLIVFSIQNGVYDCLECHPEVKVKADGSNHPVTGKPYDTISVKVLDAKSIRITTRKDGRIVAEQTRTVTDDGNTLTVQNASHPSGTDRVVRTETVCTRDASGPAGSHATSGSWRIVGLRVVPQD